MGARLDLRGQASVEPLQLTLRPRTSSGRTPMVLHEDVHIPVHRRCPGACTARRCHLTTQLRGNHESGKAPMPELDPPTPCRRLAASGHQVPKLSVQGKARAISDSVSKDARSGLIDCVSMTENRRPTKLASFFPEIEIL